MLIPPPPRGLPSVARGAVVLVLCVALLLLYCGVDTRTWPLFHGAASFPVCTTPVEIRHASNLSAARLGCADDAALRRHVDHCAARSGDAVVFDEGACLVERGGMRARWRLLAGLPIDVNRASLDDLQAIPGLGRAQAQALIAHREKHGSFGAVADLEAVPGVGPAAVHNLAPWLAVVL